MAPQMYYEYLLKLIYYIFCNILHQVFVKLFFTPPCEEPELSVLVFKSLVHHILEINAVSTSLVLKGAPVTKGQKETSYFLSSSVINLHRFCLEPLYNQEGLCEVTEAVYVGVI